MDGGSSRRRGDCRAIGFGLATACLALFISLSPASARKGGGDTVTEGATVVSVAQHSAESCSDTGIIRWTAVRGVDSYTVLFNDAAFGGAEQSVTVGEPFGDDQKEAPGSPINAPAGTHQLVWTGLFGSPPCGEPVDYSGRLTNARVAYVRDGAYVEGKITAPPCGVSACTSLQGIEVTAKGEKTYSDSTDADGTYSIKVKKGTYTVVPKAARVEFRPGKRVVRVGRIGSARANFTIVADEPADPLAVARVDSLKARGKHTPKAEFFRDGKWQPLSLSTQLRIGDKVRTDANTETAFEFAVGGRVGVREGGTVEITGDAATSDDTPRVKLTKGQMWAKCQRLKDPLEIQTGGGVIGIKG